MNNPYIVGITGGSASGKTLFLKKLLENFSPKELCVVSQDDYYHPRNLQPKDQNGIENFDTPHSIDLKKFTEDLNNLRQGKSVLREEYTFNNPALTPRMLTFHPAPVIIVEGIFVFYYPEILNILDLKIYIDSKDHLKLERRISRDQQERGYSIEDVLYRYENHVSPTYEKYIKPFMEHADMVVLNNQGFDKALEILKVFLKEKSNNSRL
ncbi:MAG: uridine-cytidine kinase [Cytophagaceae bacterium]|nr:uridine-cytidine kinase [Cytophagaceae bacterium]